MKGFKIDFFELMFLAQACIQPTPIARSMFWDRLINELYNELSDTDIKQMYIALKRNMSEEQLNDKNNKIFLARFNPDNQYLIHTKYENKDERIITFKYENKYFVNKTKWIEKEYITKIEKI